ncbi:MAG: hypothetical protein A2Y40_08690 [Candidatus Margulisbacteria bacterium GWF2_35_9]|nr:MAG: hypothetical protein A2Y40_08690 [Candidatus Margulisbacteria bacterium GWF2_35_9]
MKTVSNPLFQKLVSKVEDNLLPLPTTIKELIILDINKTSANDIEGIIQKDQSVVARVLRLANSAFYGFNQRISTIAHAIVCLGFNQVKSLAYTASSQNIMLMGLDNYGFDKDTLFDHSLSVAIGSKVLAEHVGITNPDELYVMGLLHDIGKLIINQYAKEELDKAWNIYKLGSLKFFQAEERVFGFNHGTIGAAIARKWNFPEDICTAIEFHHNPEDAENYIKHVYIVHLANGIAKTLDMGSGIVEQQDVQIEMDGVFHEKNLNKLGLNKFNVLEIRKTIFNTLKEFMTQFRDSAS